MAAFSAFAFSVTSFSEAAFDFGGVVPPAPTIQPTGGIYYEVRRKKKRGAENDNNAQMPSAETNKPEVSFAKISPEMVARLSDKLNRIEQRDAQRIEEIKRARELKSLLLSDDEDALLLLLIIM